MQIVLFVYGDYTMIYYISLSNLFKFINLINKHMFRVVKHNNSGIDNLCDYLHVIL